MWPFSTDERLRKRIKALETRVDEADQAAITLQAALRNLATTTQQQLDTLEAWLRKTSGLVHGRKGAESSAEKSVPKVAVDKMDKNALRAYVGLMPGKPAPKISPTEEE